MFNQKEYRKEYYQKNKDKENKQAKAWYKKNKELCIERAKKANWKKLHPKEALAIEKTYRQKHPWVRTYCSIISRCSGNPFYVKKGIKCQITVRELKKLWIRDKGCSMKKPSIHRKDNKKNYTYDNCQYLELIDNLKKRVFKKKEK